MMRINIYALAALSLFATAACDHQPSGASANTGNEQPHNIRQVLVRADSAQAEMDSFASLCKHVLDTLPVKGYTIRAEDLFAAMGMPARFVDSAQFPHIRVYIGFTKDSTFKLFILPVDGANLSGRDKTKWVGGRDMFLNDTGGILRDVPKSKLTDSEYVVDLNAPCPNTCSTNSALEDGVKP
jgi:hypothetical protein